MASLILYGYWRSSCAYRVRIALGLKGLDYEYRAVHLVRDGGEQRKADYLRLNPLGQVPFLVHGERGLAQSMAIFQYLETLRPEPALFPADAYDRARALQLCEIVNAGIQPLQNLRALQELAARFGADDAAKAEWSSLWMTRGFEALERELAGRAGTYALGETPSAVDAFLVPQIYNANRFGLDMGAFPTLSRIDRACAGHAAFAAAEPSRQPDAPSAD